MSLLSYKTGFFLAYQLLDALYSSDEQSSINSMEMLSDWCSANHEELVEQQQFTALYDDLMQLSRRINAGETVSMRDYNILRTSLINLLSKWISKLKVKLYLQQGLPSREVLCKSNPL